VRTLDEELVVDTTGHVATVIQDELENTYTLP
jgi:ribulose 1,5-bisphosphate synthetase/thiazole synthase